jgi:4-cresol dehydrogenase (hydroxylating)
MRVPHGIDPKAFSAAVRELEGVVGQQWVFTSEEDLYLYRDAYSPFWGEAEERLASAAVSPESVEQVQAILRIANAHRIPIYPISTGRNLGYGGAAPVYSGSVVLDLKRMNRILEIDEQAASCLVEPGVSYFDLYRHIRANKLKLWIDCPDPGWGSLIGNALDHGNGYTMNPFRDHFGAHCGMEVVLANGDLVRTGMGALPGAKTWQQSRYGFGPDVDGIFSQGNSGVVTKMGFWLMAEPEAYLAGTVMVSRHADLVPLMKAFSVLNNTNAMMATTRIGSPLQLGRVFGVPPEPEHAALLDKPGVTPEELEAYGRKNDLPYWTIDLKFYGGTEVVEAQWTHAMRVFRSAIPDVQFTKVDRLTFPLTDAQAEAVKDKASLGIPSLGAFFVGARSPNKPVGSHGHFWLSPILPLSAEAVLEAQKVFAQAFREWGVAPLYRALPQLYSPRAFYLLFGFEVSEDPAVNRKTRETVRRMIKLAAEHGWGEYRTAPAFMDDVMNVYSYNNHALRGLHERIKDALDPNGILAAGRCGIWPKHLRNGRS